ncbi:MAG: ABC transporter substrate-binding protein [Chloroflexota bacterium]
MKTLRTLILIAILLVPVLTVSAQDGGSVLRVGMVSPVQLDPHLGTNDPEISFNRQIYDYLIDISPSGELIPQLASDWTISEDGLTYTFNLVEATFHDGTPFTAADAVFSFNRIKELESPAINLLGSTFEVTAVDDRTLEFKLEEINADFLFGVASRWSIILKDGTADVNVLTDDLANFVGTGPFILQSYSDGESAEFTANPDYWAGAPALDELTFIFIDDLQAQIDAVRSDSVDALVRVAADRIEELDAEENLTVITRVTNLHPVIRLQAGEGDLGEDPRIMQAMKLATDRELLVLDLFGSPDVAIVGNNDPIGPAYGAFYEPIADEYDPEAACALLAEAGFPDGLGADSPIEFYVVEAFNYPDMAVLLQEQWEQGCIFVDILVRPENVYYGDNEWLEVDLGVTGWGSRPIPQQYLNEAYITGASFNESNWSDEEMDALAAEASMTTDIEARAEIYQSISAIFAERGPIIIPFFAPSVGVINNRVEGLELHSFPGRTVFNSITIAE